MKQLLPVLIANLILMLPARSQEPVEPVPSVASTLPLTPAELLSVPPPVPPTSQSAALAYDPGSQGSFSSAKG